MRLHNKVALITGATGQIGRAIALRFAQEGAKIVVNYTHDGKQASSLVDEIHAMGRDALAVATDVSSSEQIRRLIKMAVTTFGCVDILVNNASAYMTINQSSGEASEEKLRRLLDVDVKGTFLCCRAITPLMQAQGAGCIINMSWDHAITGGMAGVEATMLAAAKGAVHSLSMSLARELAPTIRVNVIAPGGIRHDELSSQAKGLLGTHQQAIPLRRLGEPRDVAEAALYLASAEAAFVTGQVILVNGGDSMY
ncbi:MAG TPA: SDR family oxidoreductase [Ktedonobacteraceae bacterium]|nr:SDR family oxidoreductase [Ktedonobacteraceae bacterium]